MLEASTWRELEREARDRVTAELGRLRASRDRHERAMHAARVRRLLDEVESHRHAAARGEAQTRTAA